MFDGDGAVGNQIPTYKETEVNQSTSDSFESRARSHHRQSDHTVLEPEMQAV